MPRKTKPRGPARKPSPAQMADVAQKLRAANRSKVEILRDALADYRGELMAQGHDAAARAMTRFLADFDRISRGLARRARLTAAARGNERVEDE